MLEYLLYSIPYKSYDADLWGDALCESKRKKERMNEKEKKVYIYLFPVYSTHTTLACDAFKI